MILTNVRKRPAPSVAAASSTSRSRFCSTGCSVRTTNGMPTKVSAMTTPSGVEGAFDAQRHQVTAQPAVRREQIGQRQARHRGRQREREIHHRINEPASGKLVAHQHPGQQRAEDGVGDRGNERGAKGQPVGRQGAIRGGQVPEVRPGKFARAQDQAAKWDQHDRAQVKEREAHRQAEAGQRIEPFLCHVRGVLEAFGGD